MQSSPPKELHSENEPGGAVLQGPPRHVGAMRQHPTVLPEATHLCLPPIGVETCISLGQGGTHLLMDAWETSHLTSIPLQQGPGHVR